MAQRIVIVDDSALNRRMLEHLVAELDGVQVLSFGRSDEALKRAPKLGASLFIVDYRMPAPDGMEMLRAIRSDRLIGQTPVVMVTAADEREICYTALDSGASDFLVRPIDPREFTRRIGNLLALEASRSEAARNLQREEAAARINGHRLDLIWRAGSTAMEDAHFLYNLVDGASRAIAEDEHFAGVIARLDRDEFEIELANEVAEQFGEGVGRRVPVAAHRAAVEANVIDAVTDLPVERRGVGNWRAALFAPFLVEDQQYFVGFLSQEPKSTPFDSADTSFIETIANLCAARLKALAQSERLRYQTEHDALTSLMSRGSFRENGFAALRRSLDVALLVINIDEFRHTNDTLGQETGDRLLVGIADRLSEIATDSETVGRLGGDYFGVLIEECASRELAAARATVFMSVFGYPFSVATTGVGHSISLGASIGIARSPDDAEDFEMLLARADAACYGAKDAGRGRFAFFDRSIEEKFAATRALKEELQTAIASNAFVMYFQPHVRLATGRIEGVEALIRWHHPQRGLVEPGAFIPFAERHGLAGAIGAWVMRETARATERWRRADPNFRVWFNLTASELRDATLLPRLQNVGTDIAGLGVEITESVAMQNVVETLGVMEGLRGAGIHIALDDFGTGYSSLAQLKRLPLDVIKIDRAFVKGLPNDRFDVAIVDAVLSISRNFGFETLAEGIEENAQADFMQSVGCTFGQGFLYGRPMPSAAFDDIMHARWKA